MDIDRDWKPTVRGKIERTEGGARISASSGEKAERLRQRLPKQLAPEGLQIQGEEMNRDQFNEVEVNMRIDGVAWLRAAAKMAVASLSRPVDEAWLDTDDAKQLRSWMWDEEPIFDDGSPAFAYPREPSDRRHSCSAASASDHNDLDADQRQASRREHRAVRRAQTRRRSLADPQSAEAAPRRLENRGEFYWCRGFP